MNKRPDIILDLRQLALGNQIVSIINQRQCPQRWAITLGATPGSCEGSNIDVKLGFTQARAIR